MPSPGGQTSGIAGTTAAAGPSEQGCGIPPASLKGYHTPGRGQSHARHAPISSRAAPSLPRGRAPPDRRDATRPPASKIIGGPSEPMIVGHFMATKHIQITQDDHRQRAFAVENIAGDRCYPRTTTTVVRESLVLKSRTLASQHLRLRRASLRDGPKAGRARVVGHQGGAGIPLRPFLSCEQNNHRRAVHVL